MDAPPARILASGTTSPVYDVINRVYALFEYPDDRVATIESTRKGDQSQALEVIGSQGRLTLPLAWTLPENVQLHLQCGRGWATFDDRIIDVAGADPYQLQLANMCDVIESRARPGMPLAESVRNVHLLEAIADAITTKQPVNVELKSCD